MNNTRDANQHYITESFVKGRFGDDRNLVELFYIKYSSWKGGKGSPQFIFSGKGYTQILIEGEPVENSLEIAFSDIEGKLPTTLSALDDAATREFTPVPRDIYWNLCCYCAYLWHLSPYAKARAAVEYLYQLDMELKVKDVKLLENLRLSNEKIAKIQSLHLEGFKFVIYGKNYLQWFFRHQFSRNANRKAETFFNHIRWTVYNSPIQLPISDIALVDYSEKGGKANLFILPISPSLVLIGRLEFGTPPPFYTDTIIQGKTLNAECAEDILDIICLSGIKAIVCKSKMDISAFRERAIKKQIKFTSIMLDMQEILLAGTVVVNPERDFWLMPVSKEGFNSYIANFVKVQKTPASESRGMHIAKI